MNIDSASLHPTKDQWSAFLYGELTSDTHAALEQHLAGCAACRQQVEEWRATMAALDAWRLPVRRTAARSAQPLLKWAAAAAILLGVGLVAGRLSAPRVNPDQIRSEMQRQFRTELQSATAALEAESDRKLEDLAQAWATARAQDQQATLTLYQRAEAQRKTDLAWLRRDVETLALNAEQRIDTTQRGLSQLAAASQTFWERPDPATPRP
jgi:hypothetical protein